MAENTAADAAEAAGLPPPQARPVSAGRRAAGAGKGINCWDASPDSYSVVAELPIGKLIKMTLKAGEQDKPHDHPLHYLYVIKGGSLTLHTPDGPHPVEMKDGMALPIPAGPHTVQNTGTTDVEILFVEPTGTASETPADHVTPFSADPDHYKILAEDDEWFIAQMTLEAGKTDNPHSHSDHLLYVLSGEGIAIYPGKEKGEEKMDVALTPGMAMGVPNGHHIVTNTGTSDVSIIFWEPKPKTAAPAAAAAAPGTGIKCYDASPANYSVVAELPVGKLIKMTMKPGEEDVAHDHPTHPMYVVKGGKLQITEGGESAVKEIPSGASIIMHAGPHQVKNVGDTEVEAVFLEPSGTLGNTPDDFKSPFETDPEEYKLLAEDDDWFIGEMSMKAGQTDHPHAHRNHFVYVLSGDEITIFPGKEKDESTKMVVPIKAGAALPVPDGHHVVSNSGKEDCKMIFWEAKK